MPQDVLKNLVLIQEFRFMKNLIAKLLAFYLPILKQLAASGMAALLPVALEIVRSLVDAKIPSNEKFNLAVNRLKESAIQNGIEASESLIRYTVESAVQKLKANQ